MADQNKKYYWLKLRKDFFERHDIRIIRGMDNGDEYLVFYLFMLAESIGHEGRLRFSDKVPYTIKTLAALTGLSYDIVEGAIETLSDLGMLQTLEDGTIYLPEFPDLVGSDTEWAKKKREYRTRRQNEDTKETDGGQNEDNERTMSDLCPQKSGRNEDTERTESDKRIRDIEYRDKEIHISKDIHTSSDIHKSKHTVKIISSEFDDIIAQFNSICISLPKVSKLTETRKKNIKARLNDYSVEDLITVFEKAEASDFLSGRSKQWTGCSFDWLIKPANLIKVLEGNYDNKNQKKSGSYIDAINNRYDVVDEWLERRHAND